MLNSPVSLPPWPPLELASTRHTPTLSRGHPPRVSGFSCSTYLPSSSWASAPPNVGYIATCMLWAWLLAFSVGIWVQESPTPGPTPPDCGSPTSEWRSFPSAQDRPFQAHLVGSSRDFLPCCVKYLQFCLLAPPSHSLSGTENVCWPLVNIISWKLSKGRSQE